MTIRVMPAARGYEYLLRPVAAGDGDRDRGTPLTRYYMAEGTPPGRWLGSGLAGARDPRHNVRPLRHQAGGPQLHTHVVVSNKVQGIDGKWRTLHRATVALSTRAASGAHVNVECTTRV
jgi:hypothetical protein